MASGLVVRPPRKAPVFPAGGALGRSWVGLRPAPLPRGRRKLPPAEVCRPDTLDGLLELGVADSEVETRS